MKKVNNKGFTLIELLATITILAVMMLLAIPNVVGVVQRNRNKTYVEDAKKMITLAKYKVKSDLQYKLPINNSKIISLKDLDQSNEVNEAPNGGAYDREHSCVLVKRDEDGKYTYTVEIIENKEKNNNNGKITQQFGAKWTEEDLFKDKSYDDVQSGNYEPQGCNE